ncbi:hypothetical protein [Gardnerella piotii]
MANSVSQRRDSMNNIFITLNLAILATISIAWNIKSIFLLVSGIVFCCVSPLTLTARLCFLTICSSSSLIAIEPLLPLLYIAQCLKYSKSHFNNF